MHTSSFFESFLNCVSRRLPSQEDPFFFSYFVRTKADTDKKAILEKQAKLLSTQ